jgi:hypothetical protein
VVAR